jgi:hypothetical protein
MVMRTKKGNVTSQARKKSGMKGSGKFPVFDERSAMSAIKLRHNGKGVSASSVLNKVAAWARRTGNKKVLNAVSAARNVDKGK